MKGRVPSSASRRQNERLITIFLVAVLVLTLLSLVSSISDAAEMELDVMAATGATMTGKPPTHDFGIDSPNEIFNLNEDETKTFLRNVEQNKGFVWTASIKPAPAQAGTLVSVDTPHSHRPANMRIFYDARRSSFHLEYSVKGNNVVATFSHVALAADRFHDVVLIVHEMKAALFVNCLLVGEQALQSPIYNTPYEKNMQLRVGQTTAFIRSRPPYRVWILVAIAGTHCTCPRFLGFGEKHEVHLVHVYVDSRRARTSMHFGTEVSFRDWYADERTSFLLYCLMGADQVFWTFTIVPIVLPFHRLSTISTGSVGP